MGNCAVILAAGDGQRMKSEGPKVLCEVLFKPMLDWVLDAASDSVSSLCVVTGHKSEEVKAHLRGRAKTVMQTERLGTGHAVKMAAPYIESQKADQVLVLCGDAPLLDAGTIRDALSYHIQNRNHITVISAVIDDPYGYGRIVRDDGGRFIGITEQKDADNQVQKIKEVNSGAYWFEPEILLHLLQKLTNDNRQKEYYLTQTVELAQLLGGRCAAYTAKNPDVVLGANDRIQLMRLNERVRKQILLRHMQNGVSIPCADGLLIGPDVKIGTDSVILPGCIIYGKTVIGKRCRIGPGVIAADSVIGDGVNMHHLELRHAGVPAGKEIEPFKSILGDTKIL